MSPAEKLAAGEGFAGDSERRKRLGQYFTGVGLGRVLAALADAGGAGSILDPMSGSGDLLAACAELGAKPADMGAIDIDPLAMGECENRLPAASCVLGSAFDASVLAKLPRLQWDLVIANPPYVRYQSISKGAGKGFPLPGAVEIRNGLLGAIDILPSLDKTDRELFKHLVRGYSGLADIAVPSWILCAGLVAPGGRIALVVPESWLSRDYATVVHYLLLRWFDIEFIVEDEHAAWFADAQVKTTLLVAKRVPRRPGAFEFDEKSSFLKIAVSGRASGPNGPCSRLCAGEAVPELAFATKARKWLAEKSGHQDELVRASNVPLSRVAANLRIPCSKQKWLASMGETSCEEQAVIPHELAIWLGRSASRPAPVPLSSLGMSIGQGLRTGANQFFYADEIAEKDGKALVFGKEVGEWKVRVPSGFTLPVVRRQSDLPEGFSIDSSMLTGRVLDLRGSALPEDIADDRAAKSAYRKMPAALADFVRHAGSCEFGSEGEGKRIWELSAVAPNIRKAREAEGIPPRFWYMLPDFSPRHRPDILIARINTRAPKAFLNKDKGSLVDANFATIWMDGKGAWNEKSTLAFLNSSWCVAALEYSAAVMGGGALKVEAAHLRRLPVPPLGAGEVKALSSLGQRLSRATKPETVDSILREIDRLVTVALLGDSATDEDTDALRDLARAGRERRAKHKNKGKAE